jgi:hypothetical protein
MDHAAPRVTNNTAAGQFEIRSEAGVSVLKYRHAGGALDLVHTEVPDALEGKGYGKALVEGALDFARAEHLKIIPSCPFVKHYVERHPETASLVADAPTDR